jgi:hypothetical protein
MMPVGTLVGINAAGNTVSYTVPLLHLLHVVRVEINPSPALWSNSGGYHSVQSQLPQSNSAGYQAPVQIWDGYIVRTASARINGYAVASYESRLVQKGTFVGNTQGNHSALAIETVNTSGAIDLHVAGATVVTFQIDSGFTASWIGYLTHPPDEKPECVCTPQPVTTPEPSPSPTPTPSATPTGFSSVEVLPPSTPPTPVPSSEPNANLWMGLSVYEAHTLLIRGNSLIDWTIFFMLVWAPIAGFSRFMGFFGGRY